MKIRTGFVSNSSSSSFIIRGSKLATDEIIKTLGISQKEIENLEEYDLFDFLESKLSNDFDVEIDGNYFDGRDYGTLVVGKSIGSLEDGEVMEMPESTPQEDKDLLDKFEALGFKNKVLKTYVQMISNDNY
jgi:hypothetical protein